ncbi:hypothetical protein I4U23_028824 [Adineta vaga]|nr:hypothetical protein I4U23_028824 [Adineta vaga]
MADLDSLRTILHSRHIDSSNVKPYTGFRLRKNGDLILTTPSLDSCRVNNNPLHRYEARMSADLQKEIDYRILSYDALENRRYQELRMKQPMPYQVTRIFQERFGSLASPRVDSSRIIRTQTTPGYRFVDQIPHSNRTMVSQRFNKISPFVTEHGNNPNAKPTFRQSAV